MKCVILQPSYIPWRGYFDQIHRADIFVFYDDVQFDKHGWRNRNRIKTPQGSKWITIPVLTKGTLTNERLICDTQTANDTWPIDHWKALVSAYGKAPYFHQYEPILREFYEERGVRENFVNFVINLTITLAGELGMTRARFLRSSELGIKGGKTERLVRIVQEVGATHYLSGPSARNYLEEEKFEQEGIVLEYMTYDYPEYEQLYPPYDPQVSILDLLFMKGPDAPKYIWG